MNETEFKLTLVDRLSKIEEHTKLNAVTFKEHLEQDLDIAADVARKLHALDITLSRNTDSLEIHMRRTALLESEIANRVTPIEKYITEVHGAVKLVKVILWIAAGVSVIAGAIEVLL